MRGEDRQNHTLFSYVRPDSRIPPNHPLRLIRRITDAALASMSTQFDAAYSGDGRPSIPPERLLRALLIQALYSVRSERLLMEQMDYNLLFRWFVGLAVCHRRGECAHRRRSCRQGRAPRARGRLLTGTGWRGAVSSPAVWR